MMVYALLLVRLLVRPESGIVSPFAMTLRLGDAVLTAVQVVDVPNTRLPMPVPTVPFCAKLRLLPDTFTKRTCAVEPVLRSPSPSMSSHAASASIDRRVAAASLRLCIMCLRCIGLRLVGDANKQE